MTIIRSVVCSFLLIAGAFAVQTTPSGPVDQSPAAPQANPQKQMPQAQPPETRAPQPSDQAPQAQPPQAAPQAAQPPSIDEQVAVLTQELHLSDDQQTKVKTILVDQRQQAMGVVGDQNLSRADKIEKIHAIRESTISKVRDSLNDDQKKKLDQMLQGPSQPQQAPGNNPPK
ncbi:MAG TPA: hypothetical protein VKW06_13490 [Candidatus Angelobacter sp.]|nr:hypothetical protein [Candidatus Angelobacter sp.]